MFLIFQAQVFNANGRPAAHIQVSVVAKATTSSGTTVILGGEEQNGIPEDSFKTSDHLGHVKYNLNVPSEIEQINITVSDDSNSSPPPYFLKCKSQSQ